MHKSRSRGSHFILTCTLGIAAPVSSAVFDRCLFRSSLRARAVFFHFCSICRAQKSVLHIVYDQWMFVYMRNWGAKFDLGTKLSEEGVDRQCGMLFLVHRSSKHMVLPIIVYFLSYVWLFWDPVDCILPGSSVHEIFQARILECIAISFSRESSWNRDWTHISCIGRSQWATLPLSHWGSPLSIIGAK